MPTLTISSDTKITPSSKSHPASFGHLWYTLTDKKGVSRSFGFAPTSGRASAMSVVGAFNQDGATRSTPAAQDASFQITQAQFDAMMRFSEAPQMAGFSNAFNRLTNNSVDFVAAALRSAGIDAGVPAPGAARAPASYGGLSDAGAIAARAARALDKASIPVFKRVAIDLDGNGIALQSIRPERPLMLDREGENKLESVGWIKPSDGWLVQDINKDGRISINREMYSDMEYMRHRSSWQPPLLRELDDNQDELLDQRDAAFSKLRVWRDLNEDGESQPGELTPLSAHGITAFRLTDKVNDDKLRPGNSVIAPIYLTKNRGRASAALVNLDVDTFRSRILSPGRARSEPDQNSADNSPIPNIRGGGAVVDLADAARGSSRLRERVQSYLRSTSRHEQLSLLDDIINAWADTSSRKTYLSMAGNQLTAMYYTLEGLDSNKAASNAFLKKLGVVERFMNFAIEGGGPGFSGYSFGFLRFSLSAQQIRHIEQAYDHFKTDIDRALSGPSRLKRYEQLFWEAGTNPDGFAALEAAVIANPGEGLAELSTFVAKVGAERLAAMGWDGERFLARQRAASLSHSRRTRSLPENGRDMSVPAIQANEVDALVSAMAAFPSAATGTSIPPQQDHARHPVLAEGIA